MCGIIGYIGDKKASDILISGLSHLEYRGYDSSGVALMHSNNIDVYKAQGKLINLIEVLKTKQEICEKSNIGIGHIRWATHGLPTTTNAHPHTCNCKSLTLVHNGIIENYQELKEELIKTGCIFQSQTDTEVAAHLIAYEYGKTNNLLKAMQNAVKKIKGAFAFCAIHKNEPNKIVVAKRNAPLIIGVGENENFVASDIPAIIEYTKKAIYLSDYQVGVVQKNNIEIYDDLGNLIPNKVEYLPFEAVAISKMGYKHFMLKEIHEQSDVVRNVLSGKLISPLENIKLDECKLSQEKIKNITRVQIIACGTSLHAGMVGKYIIEKFAQIPVDVEPSSEYIYRDTIADENTLVIGISQSGETADTITAIKQVKEQNSHIAIITNRTDSTMARLADSLLPISAGIEVSVAATKSYMAQLISLYLLAIYLMENKNIQAHKEEVINLKQELIQLPNKLESLLENTDDIRRIAKKYSSYKDFIFIARGINFPSALEGALKLKEISYINATGYGAGELKHGPIAMLDENMPVLAILNTGIVYDKVLSNCEEARARQAKLIGVTNYIAPKDKDLFDDLIMIPSVSDLMSPAMNIVVLQLLAYYIAEYLGKDVDQPRNLAKSVTVE
ncbi:MAG: glutamine--fructose-6-phosphate transaminase (isomerizing) [Candidatus Gastranaerophilales bacterium]|nr:glutamine--fructose-6-phosphate transaminase (isomerizing) [Candidatus Gastranaerophilales bacterium]